MPSANKVRIRHAVTIDVLIPAIEKDLATLPMLLTLSEHMLSIR